MEEQGEHLSLLNCLVACDETLLEPQLDAQAHNSAAFNECACMRDSRARCCRRRIWRSSELSTLVLLHSALGNKWSAIAKYLPGRTDNDCKNIFYSALRSKTAQTNRLLRTYAQAVGPNCDDSLTRQSAYKAAKQQIAARSAAALSRAVSIASGSTPAGLASCEMSSATEDMEEASQLIAGRHTGAGVGAVGVGDKSSVAPGPTSAIAAAAAAAAGLPSGPRRQREAATCPAGRADSGDRRLAAAGHNHPQVPKKPACHREAASQAAPDTTEPRLTGTAPLTALSAAAANTGNGPNPTGPAHAEPRLHAAGDLDSTLLPPLLPLQLPPALMVTVPDAPPSLLGRGTSWASEQPQPQLPLPLPLQSLQALHALQSLQQKRQRRLSFALEASLSPASLHHPPAAAPAPATAAPGHMAAMRDSETQTQTPPCLDANSSSMSPACEQDSLQHQLQLQQQQQQMPDGAIPAAARSSSGSAGSGHIVGGVAANGVDVCGGGGGGGGCQDGPSIGNRTTSTCTSPPASAAAAAAAVAFPAIASLATAPAHCNNSTDTAGGGGSGGTGGSGDHHALLLEALSSGTAWREWDNVAAAASGGGVGQTRTLADGSGVLGSAYTTESAGAAAGPSGVHVTMYDWPPSAGGAGGRAWGPVDENGQAEAPIWNTTTAAAYRQLPFGDASCAVHAMPLPYGGPAGGKPLGASLGGRGVSGFMPSAVYRSSAEDSLAPPPAQPTTAVPDSVPVSCRYDKPAPFLAGATALEPPPTALPPRCSAPAISAERSESPPGMSCTLPYTLVSELSAHTRVPELGGGFLSATVGGGAPCGDGTGCGPFGCHGVLLDPLGFKSTPPQRWASDLASAAGGGGGSLRTSDLGPDPLAGAGWAPGLPKRLPQLQLPPPLPTPQHQQEQQVCRTFLLQLQQRQQLEQQQLQHQHQHQLLQLRLQLEQQQQQQQQQQRGYGGEAWPSSPQPLPLQAQQQQQHLHATGRGPQLGPGLGLQRQAPAHAGSYPLGPKGTAGGSHMLGVMMGGAPSAAPLPLPMGLGRADDSILDLWVSMNTME